MARADPEFDVNIELAARRTGMAFQRTRMAADRTLMTVMGTSLTLISFGFTIFQLFQRLRFRETLPTGDGSTVIFGEALVGLGLAMLVLGIVYHIQYMRELGRLRASMRDDGLIRAETAFPISIALIAAFALLGIGIAAIASMAVQAGQFG